MKRFAIVLGLVVPTALLSSCCCTRHHHETAEMKLCAECGMAEGAEGCCDPSAARCDACGMIEGSPGCCAA
jgi:hypothetical protein